MTLSTGIERAHQFRRGFGDGAKNGAVRFPDDEDYGAGLRQGREATTAAVAAYIVDHNLDVVWPITREAP